METRSLGIFLGVSLMLLACLPTHSEAGSGNKLSGTWNVTVTRATAPPGQPLEFPLLYSFVPGGVALQSGSLTPYRSLGHGTWQRDTGRSYTVALEFFRFDAQGVHLGSVRETIALELSADGDALTGTASFEILAVDGSVVAMGTTTLEGVRMGSAPQ
jgi:hypothetical protein